MSLLTTGLNLSHHLSSRTNHLKLLSCSIDSPTPSISPKIIKDSNLSGDFSREIKVVDYAPLIKSLNKRRLPDVAHEVFIQMKSDNLLPNYRTLSALMLCFAENGFFSRARTLWEEILHSSFVSDLLVISKLIPAYEQNGCFTDVFKITKDIGKRHPKLFPTVGSDGSHV